MISKHCSVCGAPLSAVDGFAFCQKCSAPQFLGDSTSPFEVLGAPPSFSQDEHALETKYYDLSKRLHPDRFAAGDARVKVKSQELSALLNRSYLAVRQRESCLEALLTLAGALKGQDKSVAQNQIPADLAEEYFEIQEAVMEESDNANRLVENFREKLEEKKQNLTQSLYSEAQKTDWTQLDASETKNRIQKILELRRERSYVRSMLDNLEKLGAF